MLWGHHFVLDYSCDFLLLNSQYITSNSNSVTKCQLDNSNWIHPRNDQNFLQAWLTSASVEVALRGIDASCLTARFKVNWACSVTYFPVSLLEELDGYPQSPLMTSLLLTCLCQVTRPYKYRPVSKQLQSALGKPREHTRHRLLYAQLVSLPCPGPLPVHRLLYAQLVPLPPYQYIDYSMLRLVPFPCPWSSKVPGLDYSRKAGLLVHWLTNVILVSFHPHP